MLQASPTTADGHAASVRMQRTLWSLGVLSNCSDSSSCPMVDLNNRQYTSLASSNTAVAQVMAAYPPPNASEY
jgi:hypothetical protein